MTRTRAVIPALGLLSALALGACSGDDPEPRFAPPSTTAPSAPETTPAPEAEPTMPAAARERSGDGAKAFVRYWIAMVNFAQRTGDVHRLRDLNDVKCIGCQGLVDAVEAAYAHGGHIEGGTWSAGQLRELPLDYGAEWAAHARARTAPQIVVDDKGKSVRHSGAGFDLYTYLTWSGGWRMRWLRTPT